MSDQIRDDLLAACKAAIPELRCLYHQLTGHSIDSVNGGSVRAALNKLNNAIDRAEGQRPASDAGGETGRNAYDEAQQTAICLNAENRDRFAQWFAEWRRSVFGEEDCLHAAATAMCRAVREYVEKWGDDQLTPEITRAWRQLNEVTAGGETGR